ncbi:HPr(Ser) kinase/phosphatase [Viridibacillus sp. FSL R5-0477]|uniref:HPr kinase/phosphorylase n=1 Tax=Viridibacillus arenosi FSL R5-213 TaxID=1227360 RepID=W4EPX8_9BACL|nr:MULTISPECIES: HPr(Ser) kinase/phosphatase [Viridibacillus]ETT82037.1 HPr kinase/phosphorylase [Viridibacillus arenosi FSL R5-213]OMC81391.1 HPr kinase/phosphorylase [Viridibacillus sp. FSL H8-0123]OMC86814.1 HPr kinase/phosphorylase [Viridibacillus sp. FSL H7-0596]OMC90434.1 HPr kinase/phosphorylase [Viridibacillus arenosi]
MDQVCTKDVIKMFDLKLISGHEGIGRHILTSDISRPGLEMAGYFTHYPAQRVQLLGKTELSFFDMLPRDVQFDRMNKLCSQDTPAIIISHDMEVPEALFVASNEHHVPVLSTKMATTRFSSMLTNYLESQLAPTTAVHGVLADIYGIGVLITGKSGVGKSETALELVKKGHRLVADDCVEIRQEGENTLIGNAPALIQHLLEIRGIGIIDIMTLFGASAVRSHKRISLVIDLEVWDSDKTYDRLGLEEETMKIIDTELTKLTIPVKPGRNLSVIIEVAAMNYRLKKLGVNAAEEFSKRLDSVIESKEN